jgi:hypothetical protein
VTAGTREQERDDAGDELRRHGDAPMGLADPALLQHSAAGKAEHPEHDQPDRRSRGGAQPARRRAAGRRRGRAADDPLAEPFIARLWLVSNEPVPELAEALRSGLTRSRA